MRRRNGSELSVPRARAIGAVLVAGTLVLLALAYFKPNPFASHETVRAAFADAGGVGVVGADVRMAGTVVGEISKIEREGDHAILTLKLDDSAGHISRTATAELRPHLAFEGTAFVDLNPGSSDGPALGDDVLPLSQTRNYVPLDEALRFARPPVREALRDSVRDLSQSLSPSAQRALNDTLRTAPPLVRSLAPAARAARGPSGDELAGAVQGLARTADAVAREQAHLVPILRHASATFAALNTGDGKALDSALAALPGALGSLDTGGRALDATIAKLHPLARDLKPGLGALDETLKQARPLLRAARPALQNTGPLVRDLSGALAAGARATPATRALLRAIVPSANLLDASLLPALAKKTPLGMPAYISFMNLFEGGGGASRPFQNEAQAATPGSGMGTGHFMRFGFRFMSGFGVPAPPCTLLAQADPDLAAQVSAAGGCTP
jgi:ABC-type transporter Mla subunit MlaD